MLKRTALFEEHQRLGGRLIDFGGWELPVQYSGLSDEHLACRCAAGLFDVSHMGEVHAEGKDAEEFLVTSGTQSPCLKQSIAVAYIAKANASVGSKVSVDIRGTKIPAEVVPTPFYKRPY